MFHPVSRPLQPGIRFFQHPVPARQQHALRFACLKLLQAKDGVTTFRTVDPLDDLGASSTPAVLQFRAGSYKTCILTTSANTG